MRTPKDPKIYSDFLPTGRGIIAEVTENEKIKTSFLAKSKGNESLESIQWLYHMGKKMGIKITHGLNGREKTIEGRNYQLDGYAEIKDESGSTLTIGFDYRGCRWHSCPYNCSTQQVKDFCEKKDKERVTFLQEHLDQYKTIQSCKWLEEFKTIKDDEGPEFYPFLMKKKITYEDLLATVANKQFFGFIQCDVTSPQDVINLNKSSVKLPPIFRKMQITKEMVPEEFRGQTKFPKEVNTLVYNEKEGVYTSEMLNFYIDLGMKISNVKLIMFYHKAKPFKYFVDDLVERRISYADKKMKESEKVIKIILNSFYGRLGLNKSKYKRTEFIHAEQRGIRERQLGPFHIRTENMSTEYPTEMLEVTSRHRTVNDDALVQIAFWGESHFKLRELTSI
jgi:hypothetical protein